MQNIKRDAVGCKAGCFALTYFCIVAVLKDSALKTLIIMDVSDEAVQRIQKFVQNRKAAEKESTSEPLSATALHAYTRRLDGTLSELHEQVRRQEEDLRKVTPISQLLVQSSNANGSISSGRYDPMV